MKISLIILSLILSSCASHLRSTERAVAVVYNLETEQKLGVVKFNYDKKGDVVIKVELQNISAGEHGFHIHEYGDLRNHGHNLGGHFNPFNVKHGNPKDGFLVHVGDLGNVRANKSGVVSAEFTDIKISLRGRNSIIGRAVVLHAGRDNFQIQPSGHSGKKIAAGVIGLVK